MYQNENIAAWNGDQGQSWIRLEAQYLAAIEAYCDLVVSAAEIMPDDRVLDIGCGNGQTTRAAAERTDPKDVTGVDVSHLLLDRARELSVADGRPSPTYVFGDAETYGFRPESFDVVISRFGVMFFTDPVAAFANIGSGMASGGRLSVVIWQSMAQNEWATVVRDTLGDGLDIPAPPLGQPGPFSMADQAVTREILERAGWRNVNFENLRSPFVAGTDVESAFAFMSDTSVARSLLAQQPSERQRELQARLRERLAAAARPTGVELAAAAWLVTARWEATDSAP